MQIVNKSARSENTNNPAIIFNEFVSRFGSTPVMIKSPGRVNLIGEHTDYNEGFVLPAATDKSLFMAIGENDLKMIRLVSIDMNEQMNLPVQKPIARQASQWPNYILGVVDQLSKSGCEPGGFDCVFGSAIPIGAGMSSSAALEGATVFGLSHIFGYGLSRMEMALIGRKAENNFVGVNCGIMDQFANMHGKEKSLVRLDCRNLDYKYYPFAGEGVSIVLFDTMVRRELASSEYNVRRRECEQGVELLKTFNKDINSLRDVSIPLLEEHLSKMDPVVYKRCRYVVSENKRVQDSCGDLIENDMSSFGQRMYESHAGLRDEYEVSCPELDILVDAALQTDTVMGARMMGGGFGGCTINLVSESDIGDTVSKISGVYLKKRGISPDVYIVKPAGGTDIMRL